MNDPKEQMQAEAASLNANDDSKKHPNSRRSCWFLNTKNNSTKQPTGKITDK